MSLPECALPCKPTPSMAEQLIAFAQQAQGNPYTRAWLTDPVDDFMVYVRTGRRDVGPVIATLWTPDGAEPIQRTIDCLEIANLERRTSVESVEWDSFFNFIETVGRLGLWDAVCLENLGDKELTDWAKLHGWTDRPVGTPDFCYINFPDPDTKMVYAANRRLDGGDGIEVVTFPLPSPPLAIEGVQTVA